MTPRKVANPLALAVLAELLMGPLHPYEIGRRLQEHRKDQSIKYNRGSLYMVVEQLKKAGFVAEQETVRDTQRPERTVYALTADGRSELFDWLRTLVAEPRHEYPHFGVALSLLSILPPPDAVELLTRRLAALAAEAEEIRGTVGGRHRERRPVDLPRRGAVPARLAGGRVPLRRRPRRVDRRAGVPRGLAGGLRGRA